MEEKDIIRIGELSHIRELSLPVNQITDEGLFAISRLSHLKKLNLNSNKITDKGMAIITRSMPNLIYLDVSLNEEISDIGVDPFLKPTELTTLIIEFNSITREKAQELKAHINKVVYFPGKKVGSREIMMEW
ncbi:leucine-rich repeat domain-containing protein [Candidatus Paracaedibacter symbiosus]|uniref:leucine-rich repeat domain-containing protein n=1 Tax=Candidatus Paracaedibacter symbiosus TaxID=244582 RepID=UPI000509D6C0|nr:leucine-rich repeat domain-containing protein [Candidatus Paracaedibacter symbiosus]